MREQEISDPTLGWQDIDAKLFALARQKAELDEEISRWLLLAARARVHRQLGFTSVTEYAERRLGLRPKATKERLRVAEALEQLPRLRALLRCGARSWSATRELTRVATREHEEEWIRASEGKTVRELERMVAGHRLGEGPDAPKDPLLERRRLVFAPTPEVYAMVLLAMERARKDLPPSATDEDALRAMAEKTLADGRDASHQPPYQVALTLCAGCGRTWRQVAGEAIEVPPVAGECARCDAELTGLVAIDEGIVEPHVGPPPSEAEESEAPATRAEPPASPEQELVERVVALVGDGGWKALVGVASQLFGSPALRSVTPRVRAEVLQRDRGRCSVPGCRNHRFLDLHHLTPRRNGGPHTVRNIISLCSTHHRLHHNGLLAIEGTLATGLRFRDSRGLVYGTAASEPPPSSPGPGLA